MSTPRPRDTHHGLNWEQDSSSVVPRWTQEPSADAVEKVCRDKLHILPDSSCSVTFHSAGTFNKLYLVDIDRSLVLPHPRKLIMRVSLPVDPHHKTRGEVATLHWIRQNTDIPVPTVIAYDDSNENDIGFEWILLSFVPGVPVTEQWQRMSMDQKATLVERVADIEAKLMTGSERVALRGIGTLSFGRVSEESQVGNSLSHEAHANNDPPSAPEGVQDSSQASSGSPTPGRIVERHFFWDGHDEYDVPRGPFRSGHDWLKAHLHIIHMEHVNNLTVPGINEYVIEYHQGVMRVTRKLADLLPKLFPSVVALPERTYLWHDDLNSQNIFVDDQFNVTAILGWDFAICGPVWASTRFPNFLDGLEIEEEPVRDEYCNACQDDSEPRHPNEEGKCPTYSEDLLQYELTQLRKVYTARMEELWPDWGLEVEDGSLRVDFLKAANLLACGYFRWCLIENWVDDVAGGKFSRLMDRL